MRKVISLIKMIQNKNPVVIHHGALCTTVSHYLLLYLTSPHIFFWKQKRKDPRVGKAPTNTKKEPSSNKWTRPQTPKPDSKRKIKQQTQTKHLTNKKEKRNPNPSQTTATTQTTTGVMWLKQEVNTKGRDRLELALEAAVKKGSRFSGHSTRSTINPRHKIQWRKQIHMTDPDQLRLVARFDLVWCTYVHKAQACANNWKVRWGMAWHHYSSILFERV